MEPVILISVEMICAAVEILLFMCHIGYDMRARGFKGTYAVTVMHQNDVSFSDYFKRRDEHPYLDGTDEYRKMSRLYLYTFAIGILIMVLLPFAF